MTLKDFNFVKYDPKQVEHVGRHLEGSDTAGSHFAKGSFPSAKDLIDYACEQIQDYAGQRMVKEVDAGRTIGYDGLVPLEGLPKEASISKEPRGRDGNLVNIVRGIQKSPTSKIVVVAGPLKDEGKHGFYTIFPGTNAPSFPVTRENLAKMGYSGEKLENQVELNKEYEKFWNAHGFVAD